MGDVVGPVVGVILYQLVGFVYLFMIAGWSHFIYVPLVCFLMPNNVDSEDADDRSLIKNKQERSSGSEISLFKLLTDRIIIL